MKGTYFDFRNQKKKGGAGGKQLPTVPKLGIGRLLLPKGRMVSISEFVNRGARLMVSYGC